MTNTRDEVSLTRLELVVLARLSCPKPPGPAELGKAVLKLGLAESISGAKELALAAFGALRQRGLVSDQQRLRKLTENGNHALRAAFELGHTPTWTEARDVHLPALALGLRSGSAPASDEVSLTRLELVVLARLSCPKPPGPAEIAKAVVELGLAESEGRAREAVTPALAGLVRRGLVKQRPRVLTEGGHRALRAAFSLGQTPTWTKVRDFHLPALALGLQPGSAPATEALEDKESIAAAVLGAEYGVPDAFTPSAFCDVLIAETLGLPPGPMTLGGIRAHLLARRAGVEAKGTPDELAVRVAVKLVGARPSDREGIGRALARRWIGRAADPPGVPATAPVASSPPAQLPSSVPPSLPSLPSSTSQPPPATPITAETLLAVVREAIPRVGADGRFGPEKVFISAIWHGIERDPRAAELSLDRFKRWLITANRDGWLVLARADLVGAMDGRLVAESEIEDQGATFHFVLDRRAVTPGSEQGFHAR